MEEFKEGLYYILPIINSLIVGIIMLKLNNRAADLKKKDSCLAKLHSLLLRGISASIALSHATAIAVRDQKFNGELKDAQERAISVQTDIDNFTFEQSTEHINRRC